MGDDGTELTGWDAAEARAWAVLGRVPKRGRLAAVVATGLLLGLGNLLLVLFEPAIQALPTDGLGSLTWRTWLMIGAANGTGAATSVFVLLYDYLSDQVHARQLRQARQALVDKNQSVQEALLMRIGYYETLSERLTQSLVILLVKAPLADAAPGDLLDLVQALCKQIDDQVGGVEVQGKVTSNLMLAVPPERADSCLERFKTLQPRAADLANPYAAKFRAPISLDGCQDTPARAMLLLVGGSKAFEASIGAGGAWIYLRVPEREGWALPGAPRAFVRAENHVEATDLGRVFSYQTDVLQYDDVADTRDVKRAEDEALMPEQIRAMEGFFTRVGHVRSFTSIALVRQGTVVGVLNINRDTPGLFADQDDQRLITSMVRPYLPLLGEVAVQLTTHLCQDPSA